MEVADTGLGTGLGEPVRSALPGLIDRVAASVRQAHERDHGRRDHGRRDHGRRDPG
ncbi:hypothetical protein [Streptomyces murinus]|uniref:Uncharacterized protein n=1 Tax=Streptomyces murinus TaxID=33900 RepID=A0A7W3NX14_STRMR|nr:hypothetical protein [Streptomyces murinus]MBA9058278.1 hypothetical protein [Streptomyces murinus]